MPTAAEVRRPLAVLLVGVVTPLFSACGVVDLGGVAHDAVTLEPARVDAGDWAAPVELLATEIGGSAVVALRAPVDEVACADGSALPVDGVPLGTELVFVQDGAVLDGSPPEVRGLAVELDCG